MLIKLFSITVFIALLTILTALPAFAQQTPATAPDAESQIQEAPLPDNAMPVRIGVVLPKTNFFEEGVNSAQLAASIRKIIGSRLDGSGVEIISLDGRLPQAIAAEAREKSCFYILQTTVLRKRGGAKLNSLAPVASSLLNTV
jgi:hypothetical protein